MIDSQKQQSRHLRIIYTRLLERGLSKCVSYLKKEENDDKEAFLTFVARISKPIQKAKKVPLDNSYYNALEHLMQSVMTLPQREFELEETRAEILSTANSLQKILRQRSKSKEKHKKKNFDDGY